jgi:peptidyl-tRNA hydrolase, PTH1 family
MKLIVGLGNPGTQYSATRHNVGFRVVDRIASNFGWTWESSRRDRAELAQGTIGGERILLIKPQTYMNESGQSVAPLVSFYKIPLSDLLVISDDLDLPVGRIRLRERGSDGGQRGVRSIVNQIGNDSFPRLRIGIGRPADRRIDPISWVLNTPQGDDRIKLDTAETRAAKAALSWLQEGMAATMNKYNVEVKLPSE